ncbi:Coatomer subunit gamma-1 [Melia azedarach]|uniref:Coatomer subunit gamma-1 n=1 Tax=Melia azedarach TaxID=155640 RepID=A0ACC1X3B9_MELAZ|nr:Coatomer subunit gamma-1 [Melia azedarach]
MRRIPRIKFPQRHPKSSPSPSGSVSETQPTPTTGNTTQNLLSRSRSGIPAVPANTGVGGQASLQPKRTPVTNREIEAVLLGFNEEA